MIRTTEIKELELLSRGKVRDIYALDENLLIVTTDRVSAFDFVLNQTIPGKGVILNKISEYFFKKTKHIINNHFIYSDFEMLPEKLKKYDYLKNRFMVVKHSKPLPVECIVRGYITGSAWSEYLKTQTIGGMYMEPNLKESEKFENPIFTPSIKADKGHDENISVDRMKEILEKRIADGVIEKSLLLYDFISDYLYGKGIIVADTKFEFGILKDELVLIDEMFTPDSSRFWFLDRYEKGKKQESMDKQFIRDYLLSADWDKNSAPPDLPEDVVLKTSEIYKEIYRIITDEQIS